MKTSRPRSLDMSSWSVESRSSSSQTTSSSEAGSERPSPNISRNASFQSNGAPSSSASSSVMTGPASMPGGGAIPTPGASASTASSGPASLGSLATVTTTTTTQVVKFGKGNHPNSRVLDAPKTVVTLMGGRGYINWRRANVEKQKTAALAQINNCDAFLVIWEMKL